MRKVTKEEPYSMDEARRDVFAALLRVVARDMEAEIEAGERLVSEGKGTVDGLLPPEAVPLCLSATREILAEMRRRSIDPSPPETPAPEDLCRRWTAQVEHMRAGIVALANRWSMPDHHGRGTYFACASELLAEWDRLSLETPAAPASAPRETPERAKLYDADAWDAAMKALGNVTEERDAARAELEGAKAVLFDAAEYARNKCPPELWVRICGVLTWACAFNSAAAPPEAPVPVSGAPADAGPGMDEVVREVVKVLCREGMTTAATVLNVAWSRELATQSHRSTNPQHNEE